MRIASLVMVALLAFGTPTSAATLLLTNVKIQCVSQCDATGSDQVYVTIPPASINHKTSQTRSFKPGDTKAYPEIGPNSGSASTAWFVRAGDKVRILEKDLIDPDDLIKEIIVPSTGNGQPKTVTGSNGSGTYKIFYTIKVI